MSVLLASYDVQAQSAPILLPDVPHAIYHADPWGPSLSQSTATTLLVCPVKAWARHPRLGGQAKESSDAMDLGSIAHELVLGKGGGFVQLDFPDFRTKAAGEAKAAAKAVGKVPILQKHFDAAFEAAQKIVSQTEGAFAFLTPDETEVTILWKEGDVLCKCRIDHLVVGDGWATITDLKWRSTADPAVFRRNAKTNGDDIQAAAYIRAVEAVYPHLAGRVSFQFLVVEQGPPLIVQPIELGESLLSLGRQRWDRAVALWKRCLRENSWPAYRPGVATVEATPWQLAEEAEQAYAAGYDPTAGWSEESAEGGGE